MGAFFIWSIGMMMGIERALRKQSGGLFLARGADQWLVRR